jgi:hypothetical protein
MFLLKLDKYRKVLATAFTVLMGTALRLLCKLRPASTHDLGKLMPPTGIDRPTTLRTDGRHYWAPKTGCRLGCSDRRCQAGMSCATHVEIRRVADKSKNFKWDVVRGVLNASGFNGRRRYALLNKYSLLNLPSGWQAPSEVCITKATKT